MWWHVCRKEICSRHFFVKGNPIPTRSIEVALRAAARSISSAWWLHHAQILLQKIESRYLPHAFELQDSDCDHRSCGFQILREYCCIVLPWRILSKFKAFSLRGLEAGSVSLSGADVSNMCRHVMFKESIPCHSFLKFQASTPYQKLELPESRVTFRHLYIKAWLHLAHPFVAAAEKTCQRQRSRGSGHGVVVSKICYNTVIVLSVVLCDCCKPTKNCRDWAF